MVGRHHLPAGRTVCTLLPEFSLTLLFLRLLLNNHLIYTEKLSPTYRRVKLPATFKRKTKWLMKVTKRHPALLHPSMVHGFLTNRMLPGKRTPWESRKQSQPVRSGPQPLLNTVTTTAILRPVIRTVMTIYKAHTKANTMVGPKIKVLISHRECPQVLCPRRILGFHIHECTSCSPKFKTHFKKREAHANKNVFASELP